MARAFEAPDAAWRQAIHGDFWAVDVRQGEVIAAHLHQGDGVPEVPLTVWRLSPLGIEILDTKNLLPAPGAKVQLTLTLGAQRLVHLGHVVQVDTSAPKGCLVGISIYPKSDTSEADAQHTPRQAIRWQTHHMFFPVGAAANPARFNDKLFFQVVDISDNGLMVATSLRNKFIIPGLALSGTIDFPNAGQIKFSGRVTFSRVGKRDGKDVHLIGLSLRKLPRRDAKKLATYILNFGQDGDRLPTPSLLKDEGYGLVELGDAVEYDYVRNDKEYQQVLHLRSAAFQGVDGLGVVSTPEEMADTFDERSRIIVARFRNQVIGTVRLVFHGPGETFEEEMYVPFPPDFPPRDQVVEASRAATHPDFRGADLFINLMRFTMLTVLQSGRKWMVQSTYGNLVPVYKRIGFKEMNIRVPHPVFPGEQLHLLIGAPHTTLTAQTGNPFLYQIFVPHIEAFLSSPSFTKLNIKDRYRLKLWRSSAPLFRLYRQYLKIEKNLRRKFKWTKKS